MTDGVILLIEEAEGKDDEAPARAVLGPAADAVSSLQEQVAEPNAVSRKQLLEALGALRESLEELDVAEEELAQQNEELIAAREALEIERHRYRELFDGRRRLPGDGRERGSWRRPTAGGRGAVRLLPQG